MVSNRTPRSTARKIALSMAVLGAAAGISGLGTYATFTSTTSASHQVTAGTVTIALGATGASTNRLTVNATGIVPGDTMQRSFDLINSGNQDLASVTLTSTATTSSLLDTDATNGLQMVIERCSLPWVEAGVSPAFTYTCAGTTSSVIASRAVIGSSLAMSNLTVTTAGVTNNLRLTLTFPSTGPNTMQGLTSTIQYSFTGTQRAGTNK
jgi:spore coat-associated protein N